MLRTFRYTSITLGAHLRCHSLAQGLESFQECLFLVLIVLVILMLRVGNVEIVTGCVVNGEVSGYVYTARTGHTVTASRAGYVGIGAVKTSHFHQKTVVVFRESLEVGKGVDIFGQLFHGGHSAECAEHIGEG